VTQTEADQIAGNRQFDCTRVGMQRKRHGGKRGQIQVRGNRGKSHQQAQDCQDSQTVFLGGMTDLGTGAGVRRVRGRSAGKCSCRGG
jgi:hypothetical protein